MPPYIDFLPTCGSPWCHAANRVPDGPVNTVAVIVQDGAEPFGLGSLVEVWGEPEHPEDETPVFDFRICTPRPGRVRGRSDFDMYVERGLEATADADLVCVSPKHDFLQHDDAVLDALRAAHDRGAILYAHCSAAFELGAAGLLDGRECTTHWRYTDLLERDVPRGEGQARRPLLPRRQHAHRRRLGGRHRRVAAPDARSLRRPAWPRRPPAGSSYPPHRDGGQAQFIARARPRLRRPRRSGRCSSGSSATSTRTSTSTAWPAGR